MSKFELVLSTDNAAFEGYEGELELARILREAAEKLEQQEWVGPGFPERIRDINGNRVGFWQWEA